jgi:hypothetical protein
VHPASPPGAPSWLTFAIVSRLGGAIAAIAHPSII